MPFHIEFESAMGDRRTVQPLAVYFDPRFEGPAAVRFLVTLGKISVISIPLTEIFRFHNVAPQLATWEYLDEEPQHLADLFSRALK